MGEIRKRCCICGKEFEGYGYNPSPVCEEGVCCRDCNYGVVLPSRLDIIRMRAGADTARCRGKVYISGAISHLDPTERRETFRAAEDRLTGLGYVAVNPFCNGVDDDAHWREHMRADLRLLLGCDRIYMLKGWELSKGAKLELDVASSCGIRVMFER